MQNLKPNIARVGSFIKNHAMTMLSVLAITATAAYIAAVSSHDIGVSVEINGTDYGYIDSANTVIEATASVGNDIFAIAGSEYTQKVNIDYNLSLVSNRQTVDSEELADIIWSYCEDDFREAYMLYVDDVRVAAHESRNDLYTLLDKIETGLLNSTSEDFSKVKFSNRLRIEKQLCEKRMFKSLDEINIILNPLVEEHKLTVQNSYAIASVKEGVNRRIDAFIATSPIVSDVPSLVTEIYAASEDLVLDYSFVNTTSSTEVINYKTVYVEDNKSYIGTETVTTAGVNGKKYVVYEMHYDAEGNIIAQSILSETIIKEATDEVIAVGTLKKPKSEPTGSFIWPCAAPKGVSSPYGWRMLNGKADFHLGIDIPDSKGADIWAADGGTVIWAEYSPSYGNCVKIQHGSKITLYAHLDELLVRCGDKVYKGQKIGTMGDTGVAYGTHLHFEIRVNNVSTDPMPYLPK